MVDELERYAQQRVGTVLKDKYTVDRVLGVGGMAAVYAATHRNRKQVAIKMLHAQLSMRMDIRRRFLREGYVANSVKHKNAVDVIDDDVADDGSAFLVMEMLEGRPVDSIAQERGDVLPLQAVVAIGYELCDVLVAAHAAGIVHRDIKPANLFVTLTGDLKVLDFGIARLREASSTDETGTGVTMGTPSYMAPEQAAGNMSAIGPATDTWAVGATLFALLTGRCVHEGTNAQQVVIAAATQQPRSILAVAPGLPSDLARIIDQALHFDPQQRWSDIGAMRAALGECHVRMFREEPGPQILAPLVGGVAPRSSKAAAIAPTAPATTAAPLSRSVNEPPVTLPVSKVKVGYLAAAVAIVASVIGGVLYVSGRNTAPPPTESARIVAQPTTAAVTSEPTAAAVASSASAPSSSSSSSSSSAPAISANSAPERISEKPRANPIDSRPPIPKAATSVATKPSASTDTPAKKPIDPGSIR